MSDTKASSVTGKNYLPIGIAVVTFFAGIGIGYVIFIYTYNPFVMMRSQMPSQMTISGLSPMNQMMRAVPEANFSTRINISIAEAHANGLPSYARAYPNNDTLSFRSNDITLIVLAMGVQRAISLTHKQPPAYDSDSSGNAFVIDGLINPTVIIPKGTVVHVEFINLDSSENHNVIMTAAGPPYQYMPMSAMNGIVSMMPIISHADYSNGLASEYNYTTVFDNSGTYWYICMYPGHAQMGMYGKMVTRQG